MIPEKDLNWELKDFSDYPTNVSFYCVLEDFPKGKILSISDAYLPTSKEWVPVEKLFQPSEFEIWSPAQIVQYLVDTFGALKFTILVEDQHGRQKNPDYHQFDLIAPLNN
jgi:hypothetical protein